jgi:D-alanine transaminase
VGIPVREEPITATELPRVDELFIAGTTADVMPIVRVDDQLIGAGTPGPISQRLQRELRAHIDATCAAVSA